MTIIGIIAIARNYAIGKDGKLPWHYSADLKFFKETTINHAVLMGFNTWKSIGKPLPKRLNIILSRSANLENQPNLLLLRSKDEALSLTDYLKRDLFVIGGSQTYENFADSIEKWIVTEIPETIKDADTYMPENFLDCFQLKETKEIGDDLTVKIYDKIQNA